MARFRHNDHQINTTLVQLCSGMRIERIQRFDQHAILPELTPWNHWRMRITLGGTRYLTYQQQRSTLAPNTICWSGPLKDPARASWLPGTSSDVVDVTWSHASWRSFLLTHPQFAELNAAPLGGGGFYLQHAPPQLLHVLRQMIALTERDPVPEAALANQAALLVDVLARLQFATPRRVDEEQRRRVERAQSVMAECMANPMNIAKIAESLSVSPRQLQRDFLTYTGLSPLRFFNLMRLSEANFLLAETALPVSTIATSLGYVSVTHFSTAFRQIYHCSPREVRRELRSA
ncbi:helix-turn-helix transcriptional regulator [Chloroflexia bacterium SDU3-3]|nr:helix-turn-helix transcriptional regulator [Chloroflexia bacterium SDU3-3]